MNVCFCFSILAVGLLWCSTLFISYLINEQQNEPYMDEIFHVPQLQNFCASNFEWDPKITTPPGLYFSSMALLWPLKLLSSASSFDETCSNLLAVRLVNVFFHMMSVVITYKLIKELKGINNDKVSSLDVFQSINISCLPVLYFFNFLYYTDPGAVFFVLSSLLLRLQLRVKLSALILAWSIMFRQTNVVWVGILVAQELAFLLKDKAVKRFDLKIGSTGDSLSVLISLLKSKTYFSHAIALISMSLKSIWPYLFVIFGFCYFVHWNQGIVLGDRTAHVAVANMPQVLYFSLFVLFHSLPLILTSSVFNDAKKLATGSWIRLFICMSVTFACVCAVHFFTHEHLYLISDNRHYTFYLWMRIFRRFWFARYLLVLPYVASFYLIAAALHQAVHDRLVVLAYFVCIAANLIPQALLEFRYYIIPYLIFRIIAAKNCHSSLRVCVELLTNLAINAVTIYIFLYKPFIWPHDPDNIQRFMW